MEESKKQEIKVLDKGYVRLENCMGNDSTILESARISYARDSGNPTSQENEHLMRNMIKNGHTTPFEHVVFRFAVKAPLFVVRQWFRHRTWTYSELSRRYTGLTAEDMEFHIPSVLRGSGDANISRLIKEIEDNAHRDLDLYKRLVIEGVVREQAREVLPVSLYTRFYGTVDLHNLFHFLKLRREGHAQDEIREYALAIEQLIQPVVPMAFKYWSNENPSDD